MRAMSWKGKKMTWLIEIDGGCVLCCTIWAWEVKWMEIVIILREHESHLVMLVWYLLFCLLSLYNLTAQWTNFDLSIKQNQQEVGITLIDVGL